MKKLIYLFIASCLTISCKTDDVNDIRNPLPTINVLSSVEVRQSNNLTKYTFSYNAQRLITKITRQGLVPLSMEFSYNGNSQVTKVVVTGEEGVAGIGDYEFRYDEVGRLNQYLKTTHDIDEEIFYNETADLYNMYTPNHAFSFLQSTDFKRANARYFEYDLTEKGPLINATANYHFIALFIPDTNLYYILTKRPIKDIGNAPTGPNQITFVRTIGDNDYIARYVDETAEIAIDFYYKLVE